MTIIVWKDGAGFWAEIRDASGRIVKSTWGIGNRRAALVEAQRDVENLKRAARN